MPLIKVQTSAAIADGQVSDVLKQLSAQLATHTGKPEAYVMTSLEHNPHMTFGGTTEPTCYIEVKNVGTMSPAQTSTMSEDFCQRVEQALAVPANRTYIEFNDAKGHLWGWNGSTFGQLQSGCGVKNEATVAMFRAIVNQYELPSELR